MNITETNVDSVGNEVVIRLRENSLPKIEEYQDGIKIGEGIYTNETVASILLQSIETKGMATPVLPRGALYYTESTRGTSYCFIEVPPHRRTVYYHEATIENVPFPRLIFGFTLISREQKYDISQVMIAALEDQCLVSEDSEIYYYPYTNVDDKFVVCWGGSRLPSLDRVSQLTTIPELFFNSPNSDCYYQSSNSSGMTYRELVGTLQGKEFPDKYLKKTGLKLNDWLEKKAPRI
ncbi:hypothetical protein QYF50_07100 [Paenibacillus vini]|uniref:hypothetical protein n=1 Tax=Paenibacillus vini TaxID=1476024 RepID=UPI0025B67682|nr:hypothetical protein [Paenibacillus vini]MDN4067659.1 hypothetical protein [Paenibacillus vini]